MNINIENEYEIRKCMEKVNEYFNNKKKCDLKFKHHEGECCYIGSANERIEKYIEIRDYFRKNGTTPRT